jgi:hypothetical protein
VVCSLAVSEGQRKSALRYFVRLFSPIVVGSALALSLTSVFLTIILGSSLTLDSISSISKDTQKGLGVSQLLYDVSVSPLLFLKRTQTTSDGLAFRF